MAKKKITPGSVFVRKTGMIIIKFHGKQYATGLKNSPLGLKLAMEMLEKMYIDFLKSGGALPESIVNRGNSYLATFEKWKESHKSKLMSITFKAYLSSHKIILGEKDFILTDDELNKRLESFITKAENHYSITSVAIHIRQVKPFFTWAIKEKYINSSWSIDSYKPKNIVRKEIMPYSDEEYNSILEKCRLKSPEFALYFEFMYCTGMRRKETLQVKWSEVDLKEKVIRVPNKIKKSEFQKIPITPRLHEILLILADMAAARNTNKDILFRWKDSTVNVLANWLKKIEIELGIKKKGRAFHGLRKNFADSLFQSGANLDDISRLMRHESIETTMKHYRSWDIERMGTILEEIQEKKNKFKKLVELKKMHSGT